MWNGYQWNAITWNGSAVALTGESDASSLTSGVLRLAVRLGAGLSAAIAYALGALGTAGFQSNRRRRVIVHHESRSVSIER